MRALISTQGRRNLPQRYAAGVALALALWAPHAALAQDGQAQARPQPKPQTNAQAPAPAKLTTGPKQAGPWAVSGWTRGDYASHCTAERPVRGAASGSPLTFALVRFLSGYRFALTSPDWELTPQTNFPIEVTAASIWHAETKAYVVATKTVVIELGADRQLAQKLTTASGIDIKAAQVTFKLPLDALDEALAQVESCFGALKRPNANPFAAPEGSAKQSAVPPKDEARAPRATPANAPAEPAPIIPVKATPVPVTPKAAPVPAAPATATPDDQFVEERTFLTVPTEKGSYRLEVLVVRPAKAEGRLPIALITHGKNATSAENQSFRADMMLPQARDLAARGWLAVAVIRRGYGQSDGLPGVPRGTAYMTCENADLVRGFDIEAEDLHGALKVIATRPDADATRVIAMGQSLGGGTVLAFAARRPAGLLGVVNVSGGVWRSTGNGACDHADLLAAMATFGSRTRVPTLWLYAENDSLFPPALVTRMRDAFAQAGGVAELRMFGPVLYDGHRLFADFSARVKWLRALDVFLQVHDMPNNNVARVEQVMTTTQLAIKTRPVVEEYFSTPTPKILVTTAARTGAYWVANPTDIDGARERVLTLCREKSGAECTVVMENNELIRPMVTGAIAPGVTAR